MSPKSITIYHSPDADDAFMFYGLVKDAVQYPGFDYSHELSDIESLNHRALKGELDVTAISVHTFPYLKDQYSILRCGASMGGVDYGPRIVAREQFDIKDGKPRTIAIPGELTSTTLALRMFCKENGVNAELVNMHFDAIQGAVKSGEIDAGAIIHEGQITHTKHGLVTVLDLGKWWWDATTLPLPLGVNVVNRRLGVDGMKAVAAVLKGSIEYSLAHRKEAIDYALEYGRGISFEEADRFIAMYVNEITVDLGTSGEKAIKLFLERGVSHGLIPNSFNLEFI